MYFTHITEAVWLCQGSYKWNGAGLFVCSPGFFFFFLVDCHPQHLIRVETSQPGSVSHGHGWTRNCGKERSGKRRPSFPQLRKENCFLLKLPFPTSMWHWDGSATFWILHWRLNNISSKQKQDVLGRLRITWQGGSKLGMQVFTWSLLRRCPPPPPREVPRKAGGLGTGQTPWREYKPGLSNICFCSEN